MPRASMTLVHPDALELADLLRPAWAPMSAALRASGLPLNEGEPDPKPDAKPDPPKETERTVPLSEVQAERRKRQDLEQRLAALETEREETRRAGMSASERAADELKAARERAAKLEADLAKERTQIARERVRSLVRDAAQAKGFHDPSDAVALVEDFSSIETAEDAREAVVRLADKRPHLVAKKAAKTDDLREVLEDGSVKDDAKDGQKPPMTASEFNSMSADQIAHFMRTEPERFSATVAAVKAT